MRGLGEGGAAIRLGERENWEEVGGMREEGGQKGGRRECLGRCYDWLISIAQ